MKDDRDHYRTLYEVTQKEKSVLRKERDELLKGKNKDAATISSLNLEIEELRREEAKLRTTATMAVKRADSSQDLYNIVDTRFKSLVSAGTIFLGGRHQTIFYVHYSTPKIRS